MNLYDKSSLILVPSGVKASKVYSQRPENGDGDFTFSRASVANRINENDVLEQVASTVPRLDYSDSSCPSLLLEPQRTNLLLQSNSFNTTWITSGYNITGGQSGIYGSNDAWLIEKISPTSNEYIRQSVSVSNFGASIYAKANTASSLVLYCVGGYATWNLETGTFISGGGGYTGQSIEPVGNGWYRLFVSGTSTSSYFLQPKDATGQRTSGSVYIQHAQIESSTYPTSIIETTTTQVTRNQDEFHNRTTFNDIMPNQELTWIININEWDTSDTNSNNIGVRNLSAQYIQFRRRSDGDRFYLQNINGGSQYLNLGVTGKSKYCIRYDGSEWTLFYDGEKQNNTVASVGDFATGYTELNASGISRWKLKNSIIFNSALTDEECINLTK